MHPSNPDHVAGRICAGLGDSDFVIVRCDRCGHRYLYDEETLKLYLDPSDFGKHWLNAGGEVPPCLGCGRTEWDWDLADGDSQKAADAYVIAQCLRAAADGPFFPDREFHTLLGVERGEVRVMAENFLQTEPLSAATAVTVCNCFANLFGYPHGHFVHWSNWVCVSPEEALQAFERWRSANLAV